jgi:hypothetical protein
MLHAPALQMSVRAVTGWAKGQLVLSLSLDTQPCAHRRPTNGAHGPEEAARQHAQQHAHQQEYEEPGPLTSEEWAPDEAHGWCTGAKQDAGGVMAPDNIRGCRSSALTHTVDDA